MAVLIDMRRRKGRPRSFSTVDGTSISLEERCWLAVILAVKQWSADIAALRSVRCGTAPPLSHSNDIQGSEPNDRCTADARVISAIADQKALDVGCDMHCCGMLSDTAFAATDFLQLS